MEAGRLLRTLVALGGALLVVVQASGNMIDPRGYAWPFGVLDGVDARGHALYVRKIGEIQWGDVMFPVVIRWNSGDTGRSAIFGVGWSLPLAESRIVPIDANRFVMRQPDGRECRFSRNPKNPNEIQSGVHRWLGRVNGGRIDVRSHPDAPGALCGGEVGMTFRKGRLSELRMRNTTMSFTYDGDVLTQIAENGRPRLRIVQSGRVLNEWLFDFGGVRAVTVVCGRVVLPSPSGVREGSSLKALHFGASDPVEFGYSVRKDGRAVFTAPGATVVWDARRRTILERDGWTYEIGMAKPEWNNTPMRRVDRSGGVEQNFHDLVTGVVTKETTDGRKTVERLFTSGRFSGMLRWSECYEKGVLDCRVEISYDEEGREAYSKCRYGPASGESCEMREFWYDGDGRILRIREDGDAASDLEYVYTPGGVQVGVVCGEQIVSAQVANMDEFLEWHLSVRRGKPLPCPKIVATRDAPWPGAMRKAIPDWLFRKLNERSCDDDD